MVCREEARTQAHRGPDTDARPGGSAERTGPAREEAAAGLHWVCGLDTRPFRAWEAPVGLAPGPVWGCWRGGVQYSREQ